MKTNINITYCEDCPISCSWICAVSVGVQSGPRDMLKRSRARILVMEKKTDQED